MNDLYLNAAILVVDDNDHILKMIERIYKRVGFTNLRFVKSAIEALEVVKNHYFDLIVTDLNMPGMHGVDFIREVKNSDGIIKDTKFFVITAHAEQKELEDNYALKLDGFIGKPFDGKEFYQKTKDILRQCF